MKRFLKVGEASWKIVWPPGSWHTDITAQALMRGSLPVSTVPNSEPKLVPATPIRVGIEFRPRRDPIDQRRAGRDPVLHAEIESDHRRLVLSRPVDRQHRHAAIEIFVAVERDLNLLVAVHAGDRDHHRQLAAGIVRRQMQPGRNRLVLERHPHRLDVMIGERGIFGVAFALLVVVGDVGLVVLVVGPLRRAPMHRRHEEIVARGDLAVGLRRGIGLGLAAARDGGKGRADIGHLLHPLANAGEIGIGLDAARQMDVERARLVPIDAVGADDVVDQPALLVEAAHARRAALIENGRKALLRAVHALPPIGGRPANASGSRLRQHYRRGACLVVNEATTMIAAPMERCAAGEKCPYAAQSRATPGTFRLSAKEKTNLMKLAVPDMISNSYFPAEAAVALGFFRAEGLDVSLELIFPVDKAYAALRAGAVDFVGGSAHSALAAFPDFRGVKLICAQAQGMYWFLVMHADLKAKRGDVCVVKGRRIGAAPWVDKGLRGLLEAKPESTSRGTT